jgi:hypothetical protein
MFEQLGIPIEMLVLASVERVTDQTARQKYGITGHGDMSGIVFPYVDPRDGQRKTARVRRDNPEIEAGQPKRKYMSAYGDRRHLYFPPGCTDLFADLSIPIILVEAEKSSLALNAFARRVGRKYLAIALGGCWGWRGRIGKLENSHGERVDEVGPLPDLACASSGRKVIVLLDANVNTNPKVQQARRALHLHLANQGADVSIAELPVTDGINGPDDYIGIAGDDAMAAVLDAACTKGNGEQAWGADPGKGQMMRKRQAQALLLELSNDIEFFHTSDRDAFASVSLDGHLETFPLASEEFSYVLLHRYYQFTSTVPPTQALEEVTRILKARALFTGTEQSVFLRVAENDGNVYLDLGSKDWSAVGISTTGWRVIRNPPVKFWRSRGMRALPNPMAEGDISELRSFLNIADEEWPLVLTWLLAAYRLRGPFPILTLNGEQGSCKSSASAVFRNLVDPNEATLRSGPRDERDLFIAAHNSRVITLDNLSHIPGWLSDALCRLATGGGLATRKLYSDLTETIINVQRPIILNGIPELGTRGDLLDRSIVISLPSIDAANRRDEAEFWSEFESARPRILGALLSLFAATLAQLPHAKLARKPRMADFALFGVGVERAAGWHPGTFANAYETNRGATNSSVLEASPVALAVQTLAAQGEAFEGTATELLDKLSSFVDERVKTQDGWPSSASVLSHSLRRLAPNLRASGVDVVMDKKTPDRKRTRLIRINSNTSDASAASAVPTIAKPAIQRTHADDSTSPLDGASQHSPRTGASTLCLADAPDASDAPVQSSMIRGEI